MEYKVLTPSDQEYPKRLIERLGNSSPEQIYYWGPLDFLKGLAMAVISADSISSLAMMAGDMRRVMVTVGWLSQRFSV